VNQSILTWISKLFAIVETYAQARSAPGATAADANAATVASAIELVQHALDHPHAPTPGPTPDAAGGPGPIKR